MKWFLVYYTIGIVSLGLFLYGFFPLQRNQNNKTIPFPTSIKDVKLNVTDLYRPIINKMVLMVIDALRLDFVTSEHMGYLVSSYKQKGCFLTVKVEAPTVTLPRIKSLTTGSVPQFADLIFNLAGTEKHGNSFLHNAAAANKSIVFHGDDTWVTLYSETFSRYEGFSTYYVNDFYEVDHNISQNVKRELKNDDWDIMVLHYSGLDHIGHIQGPFSNLVHPKLQEMDQIISEIILESKAWNKSTLIAVTSDHGMKNSGGHGGATFEETHIPLVLTGITCDNSLIAQSDIPTTLSALLGLVLPSSGTGYISASVFKNLTYDRRLYILRYNALVLLNIHNGVAILFDSATDFHYSYLKAGLESDALKAQALYEECIQTTSQHLIRSSTEQNEYILLLSGSVLINCLCIIIYLLVVNRNRKLLEIVFLVLEVPLCLYLPGTYFLREILLCISVIHLFLNLFINVKYIILQLSIGYINCLTVSTLLHTVSLTSSSFIEEEHQVWYFLYGTFLVYKCYKSIFECGSFNWLLLLVLIRVLRVLNQTGDKWAHLPDLTDWLLMDENFIHLKVLQCISLMLLWYFHKTKLTATILCLIYIFHASNNEWSAFMGKTVWVCIVISFCYNIVRRIPHLTNITQIWVLICALLLQPYNTILLPACIYSSHIMRKNISDDLASLTVLHIWLGKVFFFCQGHSNSLASIEIAPGYVGLKQYNVFATAGQVVCHTYAFPVLTSLLVLKESLMKHDKIWLYNVGYQWLTTVVTCIIIFIQRHHLFIWTVFAPKLVFESCNAVLLLLQISIFYCAAYVKALLKLDKSNM